MASKTERHVCFAAGGSGCPDRIGEGGGFRLASCGHRSLRGYAIIWSRRDSLVVPVTAVTRVGGQYFAYLAVGEGQGMKASQRPLKLGPITGDNYPVLEGLQSGAKLICLRRA